MHDGVSTHVMRNVMKHDVWWIGRDDPFDPL